MSHNPTNHAGRDLAGENQQLRFALQQALRVIRAWHGEAGWEIYHQSAPEMQAIRWALEYGPETPVPTWPVTPSHLFDGGPERAV